MLRFAFALRRHPSALLLGVQLFGVLLYPWMEDTAAGRALFGAFGIVVLALALWVVNRGPSALWIACCLALPSVALSIAAALLGNPAMAAWAQLLESLLYFYTAGSLIAYMLQDHVVTRDELYAAGATFTLLAWAFAFVFAVCQQWLPGSFYRGSGRGLAADLDGIALSELQRALGRGPERRGAGAAVRACVGDDRTVRRRDVYRLGGVAIDWTQRHTADESVNVG
ncbi:hypothetical protein QE400_001491 [Xanthomonas sacchari]|nr:hypothetical protein [Xanthomonas sacchari]